MAVAESWQLIDGRRSSDGLTYTAVYWCSNTGAIKTETTSDGRFRAGDGPRIKRPTQAVELDQLRQRVAEVEAKRDLNARMLIEELTRNEHLEAKLAQAEQDARRLDWLEAHPNQLRFEPFSRSGQAWACCPSTKIGNNGRPHSYVDRFASARAAIDAAIASQEKTSC